MIPESALSIGAMPLKICDFTILSTGNGLMDSTGLIRIKFSG